MYDPDNTPLSTGGIRDLLQLVADLELNSRKLENLYQKKRIECLEQEVENYRLRERIKKLEYQAYLDGWDKSPDRMGR